VEVREDGVPQDVSFFREARGGEHIPLTLALVLDASAAWPRACSSCRRRPSRFCRSWRPGTRALVVQFNESVKASAEFTRATSTAWSSSWSRCRPGEATSLYDAVHYGLNRLRDEPGPQGVDRVSPTAPTPPAP
jgi:hypothetical protein